MADYYTLFSFMIPTADKKERDWLQRMAQSLEEDYVEEADGHELPDSLVAVLTDYGQPIEDIYPPSWEVNDDGLWMHNDESCGQEFAAIIAQAYLREFKPEGCLGFEIAHTCSKARLDGFGGSAVFITKDEILWHSTSHWLEKEALVR